MADQFVSVRVLAPVHAMGKLLSPGVHAVPALVAADLVAVPRRATLLEPAIDGPIVAAAVQAANERALRAERRVEGLRR